MCDVTEARGNLQQWSDFDWAARWWWWWWWKQSEGSALSNWGCVRDVISSGHPAEQDTTTAFVPMPSFTVWILRFNFRPISCWRIFAILFLRVCVWVWPVAVSNLHLECVQINHQHHHCHLKKKKIFSFFAVLQINKQLQCCSAGRVMCSLLRWPDLQLL